MSNNKFESLLELLINEENDKAEALFHEIVVEKSRDIYENLADEEVTAESKDEEVKETEVAKDEKVDEVVEIEDEANEEESIEEVGGDATDDLVKDITSDEEGAMAPDADMDKPEMDPEADAEGDVEDRVVDLEDALDELKAEFEAMMGGDKSGEEKEEESLAPAVAPELAEIPMESKEAKETVKEYKNPVKADTADHSDNKSSPVNTNVKSAGGTTANIAKGSAEEKGRPAPTSAKMTDANTEHKMKEVKVDHKDGSDASGKKSPVASK